jgi:predicted RNase H-like HicB family nuclease
MMRSPSIRRRLSMSDYVVIYEEAEDGAWGAYIPDLPGVVALGVTRSEAAKRMREALSAYVDDLRDRGDSLPAPHHAAETLTV